MVQILTFFSPLNCCLFLLFCFDAESGLILTISLSLFLPHQLLRKRHIGNDIVTIVFQEPGALPFTPKSIRSHFQHVFIIVQVHEPCTDKTYYRSVTNTLVTLSQAEIERSEL